MILELAAPRKSDAVSFFPLYLASSVGQKYYPSQWPYLYFSIGLWDTHRGRKLPNPT